MEIIVGILVLLLLTFLVFLEIFLFPLIGMIICCGVFNLPPHENLVNFRDLVVGNLAAIIFFGLAYLIGSVIV